MSIKYVVLGYLSWKPMTGYDIKKIIADSEILPWSASNNQIYHALVDLNKSGLAEKKIENQVGAPDRHVYSITQKGVEALREWVLKEPPPPPTKNAFFHQLMWSDLLSQQEMDSSMETYINIVGEKLFLIEVEREKQINIPQRTAREKFLLDAIYKNWSAHFNLELDWARTVHQELTRNRKLTDA